MAHVHLSHHQDLVPQEHNTSAFIRKTLDDLSIPYKCSPVWLLDSMTHSMRLLQLLQTGSTNVCMPLCAGTLMQLPALLPR